MTEQTLNEALLREIQAQIRLQPQKLNMDSWYEYFDKDIDELLFHTELLKANKFQCDLIMELNNPSCKTVGCIAGFACAIAKVGIRQEDLNMTIIGVKARGLLGLAEHEADFLFLTSKWPYSLAAEYHRADDEGDYIARAEATCAAIDWFIEDYKFGKDIK